MDDSMNSLENVLKMFKGSPDTSRQTATLLTDGCNENQMTELSY